MSQPLGCVHELLLLRRKEFLPTDFTQDICHGTLIKPYKFRGWKNKLTVLGMTEESEGERLTV